MKNDIVFEHADPAPPVAANATEKGRFVSIFESPDKFASRLQIAEAISRTAFVPEAFRGSPENCLVALDMAERLELNPLAVFPDLYVIDNRAAFSSKFLIALVNRSGRFSRIEYDEGVDGVATVTKSGWGERKGERKRWQEQTPNYYAIASFIEKATGTRYESPRIDIKFAEKNGWVEKTGSKWATMPEIMVRYRAAAILVRTVCPEIVMGLEWAEDLADAAETPTAVLNVKPTSARPALVAPSRDAARKDDSQRVQVLSKAIAAAADRDSLDRVGQAIKDSSSNLRREELDSLREEYSRKILAIKGEALPIQPGDKILSENEIVAQIRDATSVDELDAIAEKVDAALREKRIDVKTSLTLRDALQTRLEELEEAENANSVNYVENMLGAVDEAYLNLDKSRLTHLAELVDEWEGAGYISAKQADVLRGEIGKRFKAIRTDVADYEKEEEGGGND